MPSIIVSNDGDPSSNSYVDVAGANLILTAKRMYCPEWVAAASSLTNGYPTQETALIWATSILDQAVEWNGYKATRDQALRWPRSACYDQDGFYVDKNTVPQWIKEITAQFAYELVKQNRLLEPNTLGIGFSGSVQVGPLRATIDPHANFLPFIPMYLKLELGWWGLLVGIGEGGATAVKLLRV